MIDLKLGDKIVGSIVSGIVKRKLKAIGNGQMVIDDPVITVKDNGDDTTAFYIQVSGIAENSAIISILKDLDII